MIIYNVKTFNNVISHCCVSVRARGFASLIGRIPFSLRRFPRQGKGNLRRHMSREGCVPLGRVVFSRCNPKTTN